MHQIAGYLPQCSYVVLMGVWVLFHGGYKYASHEGKGSFEWGGGYPVMGKRGLSEWDPWYHLTRLESGCLHMQSGAACHAFVFVCHRQAALEALQVVLEAFSKEDHFAAVAEPLLATPLQHTQAAASTSGKVSCAALCCAVLR